MLPMILKDREVFLYLVWKVCFQGKKAPPYPLRADSEHRRTSSGWKKIEYIRGTDPD